MPKFRKKPVVIEAVCYDGTNLVELFNFCGNVEETAREDKGLIVPTLEGKMLCSVGDYIIKGIKGEFYPCKPDIFAATYDLV